MTPAAGLHLSLVKVLDIWQIITLPSVAFTHSTGPQTESLVNSVVIAVRLKFRNGKLNTPCTVQLTISWLWRCVELSVSGSGDVRIR